MESPDMTAQNIDRIAALFHALAGRGKRADGNVRRGR